MYVLYFPADPELSGSCGLKLYSATMYIPYVLAEPEFTRRPEAQKVGLNGVAEFHCGATGNPAPTIFWTKEVRTSCVVELASVF